MAIFIATQTWAAESECESESESESAGVGCVDRSRSRSWSRKIFIDSDIGPESESVTALFHYFLASQDGNRDGKQNITHVLTAYVCRVHTVLLSLGLHLLPGELAFNHTIRLDNHNRQRQSLKGQITWPCLINFGGVTG